MRLRLTDREAELVVDLLDRAISKARACRIDTSLTIAITTYRAELEALREKLNDDQPQ